MAPMRILCLSNMYPGPDAPDYGAFVATMCAALERRGHAVDRVVIDTRTRGRIATPRKYADLARRARGAASAADVIYAHYLFPTGAVAALAGRGAHRPWVVTAHGGDVANLRSAHIARMTAVGLRGASAVIAVSRYLAAQLRDRGQTLPPVYVANMGVDLDRFMPGDRTGARGALGLPDGPLVLAVGGLTERKNPLRLLQAVGLVRRQVPNVHLAFVGDGPLATAVRTGVRLAGMDGAVTLAGAVPHDEVARWLRSADVLALPSLVEPLGVVALEAMASGVPVVATRVGGTAEVVGRAGTLVEPTDTREIAAGVLRMLATPPAAELCRSLAAANSVDRQAARVEAVLAAAVSPDGRVARPRPSAHPPARAR